MAFCFVLFFMMEREEQKAEDGCADYRQYFWIMCVSVQSTSFVMFGIIDLKIRYKVCY